MHRVSRRLLVVLVACCTFTGFLLVHIYTVRVAERAVQMYHALESPVVYDRTGTIVSIGFNAHEHVAIFATDVPEDIATMILTKEDQWFYWHFGVHPYRTLIAAWAHLRDRPSGGASTISQQLARTLLNTSGQRTIHNKVRETLLAFALEYRHSKDELLRMYVNTVPLGGNIQGFPAAAHAYFEKPIHDLNDSEVVQLLAALSRPNRARPLTDTNLSRAVQIAETLGLPAPVAPVKRGAVSNVGWLERASLMKGCPSCTSSLDIELTERIRSIVARHIEHSSAYRATHGAVAVVDTHTGEILALVGSPSPESEQTGMRINMALATRPVGSTIKPFLYLQAFMKGARPYSLVDDREIKFDIGTGFPLYAKNYDGTYRGRVSLEEALANSLNVPTVLVQRFVTLPDTYEYFEKTLGFSPPQEWEDYSYGIALGGLELDLLTLTHAFTAFAREGTLTPLVAGARADGSSYTFTPPHSTLADTMRIADPEYVALVHTILQDRAAGVEQFGVQGSLDLSRDGYGVKTGTSRDYHDSWTIGYTGDYAVGVWLGNAENKPMHAVSGAIGAGAIWRDVMELMFTTPYYRSTPIDTMSVVRVPDERRGFSYGLGADDPDMARMMLIDTDSVIISPHDGDVFLYTPGMRIPLVAHDPQTSWNVNGRATSADFRPLSPGTYTITARTTYATENRAIHVTEAHENIP